MTKEDNKRRNKEITKTEKKIKENGNQNNRCTKSLQQDTPSIYDQNI